MTTAASSNWDEVKDQLIESTEYITYLMKFNITN